MKRHAELLRPRFELVEQKLAEGLGDLGIATWSHPQGGYFVSFNGPVGSARDSNIRLAPSYPSLKELSLALDVFVVAAKQVAARLAKVDRGQSAFI